MIDKYQKAVSIVKRVGENYSEEFEFDAAELVCASFCRLFAGESEFNEFEFVQECDCLGDTFDYEDDAWE